MNLIIIFLGLILFLIGLMCGVIITCAVTLYKQHEYYYEISRKEDDDDEKFI